MEAAVAQQPDQPTSDLVHREPQKAVDPQPTVGRTVIYKLTAEDAQRINRRRGANVSDESWPKGAVAHFGNSHEAGQELPLIVVRVWSNEFGDGVPGVNGQVMTDGNDTLWVTSVAEGTEPGQWHWPARV